MKFLDNLPELELLSQALSFSSATLKVDTRIEAFSCKPVSRERKLFKALEHDLVSDIELTNSISPPDNGNTTDSAFGPLDKRENRKTLWLLIGTLNLAFPDFDFTTVPADAFARELSASTVLASLSNALTHLRSTTASPSTSLYRSFSSYTAGSMSTSPPMTTSNLANGVNVPTHPFLKQILDPVIGLSECEVYSYAPDVESDPHAAESELGSVAQSEVDDSELASVRDREEEMWSMDGLGSVPPVSAPATPSTARKLRSGKYYLTSPLPGRGRFIRQPLAGPPRSRSQTPLRSDEDSTGGFLWSCNYFFYNRSKKRILFISHHMKRLSHATAPLAIENIPEVLGGGHLRSKHKRRGSMTSFSSRTMKRSRLDRL